MSGRRFLAAPRVGEISQVLVDLRAIIYMTKQETSDSESLDRPALEITPAMVEAGASVVSDFREISDDRELALRVYTAMQGGVA